MAIRSSKEENFLVNEKIDVLKLKVRTALNKGGFNSVSENELLNQFTGNYRKTTVYGNITITLQEEGEKTKMNIKSIANTDNLYALFTSPNQKILNAFKRNL